MKRSIMLAASGLALTVSQPLLAQEEAEETVDLEQEGEPAEAEEFEFLTEEEEIIAEIEKEMEEAFGLFGELFKTEPLTPEQEALIPLAEQMTSVIMPEGTFGRVMKGSMEPVMTTMMGAIASNPKLRLTEITGVDADELEGLTEEQAKDALDIFDPQFAERTEKLGSVVVDMVGKMFGALEPAYRKAYTRALTLRFTEAEMRELNTYFETPLGAKFAEASFSIQYDPQMLGVMEQMGPAMVEVLPDMMTSFAQMEAEFESERKFSELSQAERERAAGLLGKSISELEASQPDEVELEEEDESEFEEA